MNFKPIFYINGVLLLILSASMMLPAMADFSQHNDDWRVFAGAQILTAFCGFGFLFANKQKAFKMSLREIFLMTSISWVIMAAFAALPFSLSDLKLPYSHAFFEAMSGFTTTGSTALRGLDTMPAGILLWRAMLQWMGGMGFLVIAMTVLPILQISGMQVYRSQSYNDIDRVMPGASQMTIYAVLLYMGLTIACACALYVAGMPAFDAVCHAMSTLSTGGFSTHDASIAFYHNAAIEYTMAFFMILSGFPYIIMLRYLRGDMKAHQKDSQVTFYAWLLGGMILLVMLYLIFSGQFYPNEALRNSVFTVASLLTTTGFINTDYTSWGPFMVGLAFLMSFLGACSGSISGGIKIFRLQILGATVQQQLNKLMSPHGIFQVHYNGKPVDMSLQSAIGAFFFIYLTLWMFVAVLLQLSGLDFTSAISAAAEALGNVGPGLGRIVGPSGDFAQMSSPAYWIMAAAMLLGRLEFFTLLVILTPRFWRP